LAVTASGAAGSTVSVIIENAALRTKTHAFDTTLAIIACKTTSSTVGIVVKFPVIVAFANTRLADHIILANISAISAIGEII
jgi:hypothetical protein